MSKSRDRRRRWEKRRAQAPFGVSLRDLTRSLRLPEGNRWAWAPVPEGPA